MKDELTCRTGSEGPPEEVKRRRLLRELLLCYIILALLLQINRLFKGGVMRSNLEAVLLA
jgi:hypothetical protein